MKTKTWIWISCLLSFLPLQAQEVAYYECENSVETYPEGTGLDPVSGFPTEGTDISSYYFTETGAFSYDGTSQLIDACYSIGFDFVFHGEIFDKFVPMGKGYMLLGKKGETGITLPENGNVSLMLDNAIGLSCSRPTYADSRTQIRFSRSGEAPSRVLTLEYTCLGQSQPENGTCANYATYYIQLQEADSSIRIHFDTACSDDYAARYSIGIKGEDGDVHFRAPGEGDDWSRSVYASSNTRMVNTVFPSGTSYAFSVPEACMEPEITELENEITLLASDAFEGRLNLESSEADGIMLVLSESGIAPENFPENGQIYQEGETFGPEDTFRILAYEDLEETPYAYSVSGLSPNTSYTLRAYLYNYRCNGQRVYSDAFEVSLATRTTAPASLEVLDCGEDFISLSVEENELEESLLVACTTEPHPDVLILGGNFGSPEGDYEPGDTIRLADGSYGGTVIHVGTSAESIRLENLNSNTIYHFAAFSRSEDGSYSSLYAQADTITASVVPWFEDFSKMPHSQAPYGWTTEGPDNWSIQNNNSLLCFVSSVGGNPVVNTLTTPSIRFPEARDVRMILDYSMHAFKSWTESNLHVSDWSQGDSLIFEASSDGKVFRPFHAITQANADEFASSGIYYTKNMNIEGFAGEQVRIRIRFVSSFANPVYLYIRSMELMEISECDYPASVSVPDTSIVADRALVEWVPGESEESLWNISYAELDGNGQALSWSEAVETGNNPFYLSGLEPEKNYQVRVQAVCGIGSTSNWTYSESFLSGYLVPFSENFDNMSSASLPSSWSEKVADMQETNDLSGASSVSGRLTVSEWKTDNRFVAGQTNASIRYRFSEAFNTWLLFPKLEFSDSSTTKTLRFSIAVTDINGESSPEPMEEGCGLRVLVSHDGSYFFHAADTLLVLNREDLALKGDSAQVEVDLSSLSGPFRLAFYFTHANERFSENRLVWIDNIEVLEFCAPAGNLHVSGLTETSATLRWNENLLVDRWIIRLQDGNSLRWFESVSNHYELEGLEPATAYTVSVSHLCTETDTAGWMQTSFTTGGIHCGEVGNLQAVVTGQTSASLSWEGEAGRYRIRVAPLGGSPVYYVAEDNTYAFENLMAGTTYECSVQSLCGEAAGDTSAYSPSVRFTTEALTCFAPTELIVEDVTWRSARVTWEGEASRYQIAWRLEGETQFRIGAMVESNSYEWDGLQAESVYNIRVRSICAEGDTSAWCSSVSFSTPAAPPCPEPTDLSVESVSETSASLSWDAGDALSCILRYREASRTSYDSVRDLQEVPFVLTGLLPQTVYVWSVMSACGDNRYSTWALQGSFETEGVSNEEIAGNGLSVTASKGQIHVMNPSAVYMERIRIYDMKGLMLEDYIVRDRGNAILATQVSMQVILVEIIVEGGNPVRFKILQP